MNGDAVFSALAEHDQRIPKVENLKHVSCIIFRFTVLHVDEHFKRFAENFESV